MSENWEHKVDLLLSDDHGQNLPQVFANNFDRNTWGLEDPKYDEDFQALETGPEDDWYWESWDVVLNNAKTQQAGHEWRLYQDGSLFAVRTDMTDEDWKEWGVLQ